MSFDPTAFLNQTFSETNSTEMVPVPEGEYLAISSEPKIDTWSTKDGSSSGLKTTIMWEIQDEAVKELLGREPKVKQEFLLDLTDSGALDFGKGKNVTLGRTRAAMDLNEPGQPFAFPMMGGRMAKVLVKHREYNGALFPEVKGIVHA